MEKKDYEFHIGHRERIRNKIIAGHMDRLRPHEVLEFLLCYVLPRQDLAQLSKKLIQTFGTLENVLLAEIPVLANVEGMGRKAAEWLAEIGEFCMHCRRVDSGKLPHLENYAQVFKYACDAYREMTPPGSMQLCLNSACRLLYQREIAASRAWAEPDTLRDAMADVMNLNASNALIFEFVGNMHAEPDDYDIRHAREYAYALSLLDCKLMDVILVGDAGLSSMRQLGLIPTFYKGRELGCLREDPSNDSDLIIHNFAYTEDEDELFDI